MDAPRYVVLAVLDEPKGDKGTNNYATGGWVAAPVVGRVISRLAPLVGMTPVDDGIRNPVRLFPVATKKTPKSRKPDQSLVIAVKAALADLRERPIAAH